MSSYALGILGYCIVLAAIVGLIAASHRRDSRIATGSQVIASIRRTRIGRILLALAWAWVGWHLFVR